MKLQLIVLTSLAQLLAGCASVPEDRLPATPENYAAHSKHCRALTQQKERIKVQNAGGITYVDIPLGSDPKGYARCMKAAGYSAPAPEQLEE